jgi:hypothetical protein
MVVSDVSYYIPNEKKNNKGSQMEQKKKKGLQGCFPIRATFRIG